MNASIRALDVPTFTLTPGTSPLPLLRRISDPEARSMAKTLLCLANDVQDAIRTGWVSEIRVYPEAIAIVIHHEGERGAYSEQALVTSYSDVSAAHQGAPAPILRAFVPEREIEKHLPQDNHGDSVFRQAKAAVYALSALS